MTVCLWKMLSGTDARKSCVKTKKINKINTVAANINFLTVKALQMISLYKTLSTTSRLADIKIFNVFLLFLNNFYYNLFYSIHGQVK